MKKKERNEIVWNIVNSLLAGAISFLSSMAAFLTDHGFDSHELLTSGAIALITSGLIAVYKFQDYVKGEISELNGKRFFFDIL